MFTRRPTKSDSFSSKSHTSKGVTKQKRSFREGSISSKRIERPLKPAPAPTNDE